MLDPRIETKTLDIEQYIDNSRMMTKRNIVRVLTKKCFEEAVQNDTVKHETDKYTSEVSLDDKEFDITTRNQNGVVIFNAKAENEESGYRTTDLFDFFLIEHDGKLTLSSSVFFLYRDKLNNSGIFDKDLLDEYESYLDKAIEILETITEQPDNYVPFNAAWHRRHVERIFAGESSTFFCYYRGPMV